ncbi:MAG: hypothetical protein ACFFBH_06400 [Promethearchaeota archaeon]
MSAQLDEITNEQILEELKKINKELRVINLRIGIFLIICSFLILLSFIGSHFFILNT